jgi:hypothetical protein
MTTTRRGPAPQASTPPTSDPGGPATRTAADRAARPAAATPGPARGRQGLRGRGETGPPRSRLLLALGAAVGTVPYLGLKVAWIAGSGVGLPDPGPMHTPPMIAANAVTAALDVCVVLLALALTMGWGRRLPALVVLLPAWVGTGLLVPVAAGFSRRCWWRAPPG